jgi:HEAT repeat protein
MGPEGADSRLAFADIEQAARERNVLALLNALEQPSLEVRLAAIDALGEVGGERARLVLLGIARDRLGERPEVRIGALRSLGMIYGPSEYASLLEDFISGENKKVVSASRRMLSEADPSGFAARMVARGALDHAAMQVYGTSGEESAVPLLKGFLAERVERGDITGARCWGRVHAAVKALGKIGGDAGAEALESLIEGIESGAAAGDARGFLRSERLEKIERAAREALAKART